MMGSEPQKMIVKWSPPYIASAPDIPLDPCRLMIETRVLESFTPEGPLATVNTREVRLLHPYHYVPRENLLFMEVGFIEVIGPAFRALLEL